MDIVQIIENDALAIARATRGDVNRMATVVDAQR